MTASRNVEILYMYYVPNVVIDERICIAAVTIDPTGICTMALAADWQTRVRSFDPKSDLTFLEALLKEIEMRLLSPDERSKMIRRMEDSFSNVIQVSQRRSCKLPDGFKGAEDFSRTLLEESSKMFKQFALGTDAEMQRAGRY